ncbi:MAG: aminotransferase class IV [Pseudonocardiaceae bacterium]
MTQPDATLIAPRRLVWAQQTGLVAAADNDARARTPHVVDSWLLENGRVRGLAQHESRFAASCAGLAGGATAESMHAFLATVRTRLPRSGAWFPRLEMYVGSRSELGLWLRPAPPRRTTTALWVPSAPDPRRHPRVKGADLDVLARLREQAGRFDAADALLYLADGTVLEAAHAAVVWWRGPVLCLPEPRLPTLASVTTRLLTDVAQHHGIAVRYEHCQLAELPHLPVWTVNALHGIRQVSRWTGAVQADSTPIGPSLPRLQAALLATATPLTPILGQAR